MDIGFPDIRHRCHDFSFANIMKLSGMNNLCSGNVVSSSAHCKEEKEFMRGPMM